MTFTAHFVGGGPWDGRDIEFPVHLPAEIYFRQYVTSGEVTPEDHIRLSGGNDYHWYVLIEERGAEDAIFGRYQYWPHLNPDTDKPEPIWPETPRPQRTR